MITFAVLSDWSEEDAYSISNSSIFVANLLLARLSSNKLTTKFQHLQTKTDKRSVNLAFVSVCFNMSQYAELALSVAILV